MKQTPSFWRTFIATLVMGAMLLLPQQALAAAPGVPMIEATAADVTAGTKGEPYYITPRRLAAATPSTNLTLSGLLTLSDTSGMSAGGLKFGTDTYLYRDGAGTLRLYDGTIFARFGLSGTTLYIDSYGTGSNGQTIFRTAGGTTALILDSSQNATFAGLIYAKAGTSPGLSFTGAPTYGLWYSAGNFVVQGNGNNLLNYVGNSGIRYAYPIEFASAYNAGSDIFLARTAASMLKMSGAGGTVGGTLDLSIADTFKFQNLANGAGAAIIAGAGTFSGLISGNTFMLGESGVSATLNNQGYVTFDQSANGSSRYVPWTFTNSSAYSNTSGNVKILSITPTYNQTSGTAANTDLLINRTQTAVGSGAQYLIDAQVGGVSKFSVTNAGAATFGDTVRMTQLAGLSGTNYLIPDSSNFYPSQADNINLGKSSNPWYAIYLGSGGLFLGKTVTAGGTTGAQTINKTTGTVNFAAAGASLVVTNSLCATTSIILCTVGTNDATMKSVQAVAGSGSFTLYPNAVPTAETRVNFLITN